jgi:hypothetical protein
MKKMSRKCKKCGCEIVKIDGVWKDPLSLVGPKSCRYWGDSHIPKKKPKKAICKHCLRVITKKGKNWKDNTNVRPKHCYNGLYYFSSKQKHEPAK